MTTLSDTAESADADCGPLNPLLPEWDASVDVPQIESLDQLSQLCGYTTAEHEFWRCVASSQTRAWQAK